MDDKDWVLREPIVKVMLKLGLPIGVMQALQVVYNITDMFWLGRLGREALAAVNATWPVVFLVVAGLAGVFQAGISLVSQYWGARDYESAMNAAGQLLLIVLLLGLPVGLVAYFLLPLMMVVIGVPAEVIPDAVTYGRYFSLGFTIFGLMDATVSIFSAAGDTVTPMKIRVAGVLLNVVLDPILIFGLGPIPSMRVAGAAIATLLSDFIASLIAIRVLTKGIRGEKLQLRHLRPKPWLLRKLV
ncbi:MAG: MATE family efflux transporter, partial [Zestosphaera sp.]